MAMDEPKKAHTDWTHLPPDIEEISMWVSLHDGELKSCSSDRLGQSVELVFFVKHLLDDEEKEKKVSFSMRIDGVDSVRAVGHFLPLEKYEESMEASQEEQQRLKAEYYTKWREESLNWLDFEAALVTDPLQIRDASLVSNVGETTVRLGGFLDGEKFDDIYTDVFVRGKELSVSRSDGVDFSFDAFLELGRQYWDSIGD